MQILLNDPAQAQALEDGAPVALSDEGAPLQHEEAVD